MSEIEQAKLLSIAAKFAKAEAEEVRESVLREFYDYFKSPNYELEKAKLLSVASKFAKSEAYEVRDEINNSLLELEQKIKNQIYEERGLKGDRGETGAQGPIGFPGLKGEPGEKGDVGDVGSRGLKGDKGDVGERGEQGEQGVPGKRGERGYRGERGPQGIDGARGADGRDGQDGKDGLDGVRGDDGARGPIGPAGPTGPVGAKGNIGDKGDKGDRGSDADVEPLKKELDQFKEIIDKRISRLAFSVATAGGSPGSGEVKLNRLDDVHYPSVDAATNGQALVWDSSINKWKAGNVVGTGGGLQTDSAEWYEANTTIVFERSDSSIYSVQITGFGSEVIDYGTIAGAIDIELSRDYGTL